MESNTKFEQRIRIYVRGFFVIFHKKSIFPFWAWQKSLRDTLKRMREAFFHKRNILISLLTVPE